MFRKTIFIALAALAVLACKKTTVEDIPGPYIVTGDYSDLTPYTVTLSGYAYPTRIMHNVVYGVMVSENANPTESDSHVYNAYNDGQEKFLVPISPLKENTTYYYKAFLYYGDGSSSKKYYGEIKSFTTLSNTVTVTTENPIVGVSHVILYGSMHFEYEKSGNLISPYFIFGKTQDEVESRTGLTVEGYWCENDFFNGTKYFEWNERFFFRAVVYIDGIEYYGDIKSFAPASFVPSGGPVVDMGLSVKWGSCNVGADYPEEAGNYFAWGETSPKESYSSDNYTCPSMTSGNLPLSDDAASVNLGSGWRMPTYREMEELSQYSLHEWGEYRSVMGYMFISMKNGNAVFFPSVGRMRGSVNEEPTSSGYYWNSDTSFPIGEASAGFMSFSYPGGCGVFNYLADPFLGYSVRGVYEL